MAENVGEKTGSAGRPASAGVAGAAQSAVLAAKRAYLEAIEQAANGATRGLVLCGFVSGIRDGLGEDAKTKRTFRKRTVDVSSGEKTIAVLFNDKDGPIPDFDEGQVIRVLVEWGQISSDGGIVRGAVL